MRAVSQNQAEGVGLSAPTAVARMGSGETALGWNQRDWDPEAELRL